MKKKTLKKIIGIFLSTSLIFTTVGAANLDFAVAKSRSSSHSSSRSSKPSSSKSSSKPKASTSSNSKPSTSSKSSSSSSSSSTRTRYFSSGSRYNSNYNSYNNEDYKKKYMNYLNNNYRTSGFFTRSSIVNGMLWGLLFNSLSTHSFANASNEQKELAENIKASKVPVYMIEVKTKNGETKYATVTKEQYDKIKEGDEISLKNGNLEIKSSKQ